MRLSRQPPSDTEEPRAQLPTQEEAKLIEGNLEKFKGTDAGARLIAEEALVRLGNKTLFHLLELQMTAKGALRKRVRALMTRIYKRGGKE